MQGPPSNMTPLLRHKLWNQRSVFVPGARMRMNVVPMFLNVFVPWGIFILCCGISSFYTMYAHPNIAWALISLVFMLVIISILVATFARKFDPDPTWFTFTAIAVGIMAIAGTVAGQANFDTWSRPYYEIQDLKPVRGIDASFTPGKNLMDGGLFFFKPGNRIDSTRAWHFKFKSFYCVAPIITNSSAPLNQEYSFWAVGKDCCSASSSDFRCGSWGTVGAAGGIRVTSGSDLAYYRLAVQQAESLYSILAPAPIFLTWSASPSFEVASWNAQVFKNYLVMVSFALVVTIFCVSMMSCMYAWIGRGPSVYTMDEADAGRSGAFGPIGAVADYGTKMFTP